MMTWQTTRPRVALAYGVGGNQAETTFLSEKVKGAPEEMCNKIGILARCECAWRQANRGESSLRFSVEIRFPPKNGGFPTIASNPPFSRANTSGNSISQ